MDATSSRRNALRSIATISTALFIPAVATTANYAEAVAVVATPTTAENELESMSIVQGRWKPLIRSQIRNENAATVIPASFCTYCSRFLINYDVGARNWWNRLEYSVSLLTIEKQRKKLGKSFGCFAKSLQQGLADSDMNALYDLFVNTYGEEKDARRHIALLFALLPDEMQPLERLEHYFNNNAASKGPLLLTRISQTIPTSPTYDSPSVIFGYSLTSLLPGIFRIIRERESSGFTIEPQINLYEVVIGSEFGQNAVTTPFGPLASTPLIREQLSFAPYIYGLFGLAGATGCALTHSIVIPLDVVKTRAQTDPSSNGLVGTARKIVTNEGISGLLLGSQATIVGYFWYGLSVYPSYTFFKRFLTQNAATNFAMAHSDDIALIAGALAAVVASLGLTPIEAARIRVVADPIKYRPLGLTGTMSIIAAEEPEIGWKNLYAGFSSLVLRQVMFGSIKFLAFERACETIFSVWPNLGDLTWTSLAVSLVAGGISGTISSVVSQPADSVLTYVAKNSKADGGNLNLLEATQAMVAEDGIGSLFRGIGSRCVWAGSIIAGQFLLYDVFREFFRVSSDDLSEVFRVLIPDS